MSDILAVEELIQAVNGMGREQLENTYTPEQIKKIDTIISQHQANRTDGGESVFREKMMQEMNRYYGNDETGMSSKLSLPSRNPEREAEYLTGTYRNDIIAPITEMESKMGQIVGGSLLPLLVTGKGAKYGETGGRALGLGLTKSPAVAEGVAKAGRFLGFGVESALLAFTGGMVGRQAEATYSNVVNETQFDMSLSNALNAGGEEAVWDLAGNSLFKGGSKIWSMLNLNRKKNARELQALLREKGSTLSLDQAVDNKVVGFIGELLRGSPLSAGRFEKLASEQSDTVVKFYDDMATEMVDMTRRNLQDGGAARMLKLALKDNKRMHREAVSVLFSRLDDSVQLRSGKPTTVKTPTAGGMGGFIKEEVSVFKPPVDVSPVRGKAKAILNELEKIGSPDPTGNAVRVLKNISKGNNNLTFSDTHQLISELKRLQRDTDLKGVAKTRLPDFIESLHKQFDTAASELPDDLSKIYKRARVFSKLGASRFNSQYILKMVETDPADVGRLLLQATPNEIKRLRKSLTYPDKTKGLSAYNDVKASILNEILPNSVDEIGKTAISAKTNRKLDDNLRALFEPTELAQIKRGVKLMEQLSEKLAKKNTVGYQQGLMFMGLGAAGYGATDSATGTVLTMMAAPKMISWAMTNKTVVNALSDVVKKDLSKPSGKLALVKLSRLLGEGPEQTQNEE